MSTELPKNSVADPEVFWFPDPDPTTSIKAKISHNAKKDFSATSM